MQRIYRDVHIALIVALLLSAAAVEISSDRGAPGRAFASAALAAPALTR